jgi:hypothetical protein
MRNRCQVSQFDSSKALIVQFHLLSRAIASHFGFVSCGWRLTQPLLLLLGLASSFFPLTP